jgi:hypothetical protein
MAMTNLVSYGWKKRQKKQVEEEAKEIFVT